MITASQSVFTTEYNKWDAGNLVYYPFYSTDGNPVFPNESYVRMGNLGGLEPEFYNGTYQVGGSYNRLTPTYLEFSDDGNPVYLRRPAIFAYDDHYLPVSDYTPDTLATTAEVATKLNISDTANMLINYLRKVDTASLSNRIDLRVKYSDTATMLTPYLRKIDTASLSGRINLKLNISDTAGMLTPYLRKVDTTGKFVNNITRTAGKDSIIFFIGGTRYAIKDSVGGGGGSAAGSTGNIQFNSSGAFAGSNNLFWDNTNARLGIGTASPTVNLNVVSSTNTGITARNTSTSGRADLLVTNDAGNVGGFTIYGSAFGAPFSNNVAVTSFKGLGMYSDGGVINGGTSTMDFITGGYNNSPSMRITGGNTGNVLIGTTTAAGFKLDVNGTTRLNGNTTLGNTGFWDNTNTRLGIGTTSPSNRFHLTGSITSSAGSAVSSNINPTLVAAANSDRLVGLDINPTFTNGAFTGVWNVPLRVSNDVIIGTDITTLNSASFVNEKVFIGRNVSGTSNGFLGLLANNLAAPSVGISTGALLGFNASTTNFYGQGLSDARNSKFDIWFQTGAVNGGGYRFYTGTQENVTIFDNGNMLLQAGGTKTNAGFRFHVNATTRFTGNTTYSHYQRL